MNIKTTLKAAAIAAVAFFATGESIALADGVIRIASPYKTTTLDPVRSAAAGNIEVFGQLYSRVFSRAAEDHWRLAWPNHGMWLPMAKPSH